MKTEDKKGAILVVILAVAAGSGLVMTTISELAVTERQLNERARVMLEAKNAAEAVVEDGFSQLSERFQKQNSFTNNALSPQGGNPLTISEVFYDLFASGSGRTASGIDLPTFPYDPTVEWGKHPTEIIGGVIPPGERKFIDSRIPGNEFDPLKDRIVLIREVAIYGKATVVDSMGRAYTSYVGQNLQIRDAPLFAHAIFYNMDMEIAPGPSMDIRGGVHANGNMFVQANNSLNFHYNVSAVGKIYHGPDPRTPKASAGGAVTFNNGFGSQLSMKIGNNWLDSRNSDFRSLSSNRWNGNLQSMEHGIQFQNAVAMDPYVRDNPDTVTVDDPLNYGYQLIQPMENFNNLNTSSKTQVEEQKFSYKSGIVIEVTTGGAGGYNAYIIERDAAGKPEYDAVSGAPKKRPVTLPAGIVEVRKYASTGSGSSINVTSGLFDKRMNQSINIVDVDVVKLKEWVEKPSGSNPTNKTTAIWKTNWGALTDEQQLPSAWWNGLVYIQVPYANAALNRPDGVKPALGQWGVKLKNGGKIPNPKYDADIEGMTLATNVPLYIHGHYNSDGNSNTGSPTDPDGSSEPPAALVADAITVLSPNWSDAKSAQALSNRKSTGFTEVAAAFLMGLVPSGKKGNNEYSGGVENFPRFLEDWTNVTFRYRGSMVALFESEIANEKWGKSDVYAAPNRNWGFNNLFGEGSYPPGTPNTRTFRRVNYRTLSAEEYKEAIDELKQQMGL